MCRRPCTAIPTRTGARCDCASPGETPGPSAAADDTVVADTAAAAPDPSAEDVGGDANGAATDPEAEETDGTDAAGAADSTDTADGEAAAAALSEAEAELAAQRELRERIEKRKAEKGGPIAAGAKLSGPAADLLAAVRAVESGEKPGAAFFDAPAPAPAGSPPHPHRYAPVHPSRSGRRRAPPRRP